MRKPAEGLANSSAEPTISAHLASTMARDQIPNPSIEALHDVLDSMAEAVCRFRPDGTLLWGNRAFCELLGISRGELFGAHYAVLVHPDDLERVQAEVAAMTAARPEVVIENRIVLADGRVRWAQWTSRGFFDEAGRLIECQSAGRDITARVEAEQALERAHRRFRFLAEASALLGSSLDYETTLARVTRLAVPFLADSCTVSLTDAHGELRRLTAAHVDPEVERRLVAQPAPERRSMPEPLQRLIDSVLSGRSVSAPDVDEDLSHLRLSGEQLELAKLQRINSYMVVPLRARGRTLGVITLASSRAHSNRSYGDEELALATELGARAGTAIDNARLHEELRRADRAKEDFLATLAHELRNPMAAILNALELISEAATDAGQRQRALEVATRQVRHQARLVDDLLDVSRLARGRIMLRAGPVELGALLHQIADAHRPSFARARQELALEITEQPLFVTADSARLEQILGNLLDNASKYSPADSRVTLWVARAGDQVRIGVRDQGAGIPEELHTHIFDLFSHGARTHDTPSGGLGIGLTIAKALVELHGGRIDVSSDGAGRGSEFVVSLPLGHAGSERISPDTSVSHAPHGLRVLVVDDNADAADMLVDLLVTWGHQATAVYDGEAAIEAAVRMQPDLALVDIGMPKLDGYETARRLRKLEGASSWRLVALTGYAQPQDVEAARRAGFDRHVAKPIDTASLKALLSELGPSAKVGVQGQN
jgi:PAS domain S-box-containing protein